jgi:hypothetical protein
MPTGVIGMLAASGWVAPDPDPDPEPDPTSFAPIDLVFDDASYEPGDTITATLTGTPADDGSTPVVSYTDSSGRGWTVSGVTSDSATLTATTSSTGGGGTATLTVRTSPGGGVISRPYTISPPVEPGTYPIPFGVAIPSGACGAGYCNVGYGSGTTVLLGGDVYGSHLSVNGGRSYTPTRDGQNTADKLRIAGYTQDGTTVYAFAVGRDGGEEDVTGTGVIRNYLLKATLSASGTLSAWTELVQLPGAWASGGNGYQLGDDIATKSGHPRETGKMLEMDRTRGLFYVGSWDGLWRVNKDGTGITRIWGAGTSITAVVLDPVDQTTAYVTTDIGAKKGVWRLTGVNGASVAETGWTGANAPYPQSLAAVRMGSGTHIVVATGKRVNDSTRTWAVAYLAPGAPWATGWRDITGVIGDDIAAPKAFLSAGIDMVVASGELNLVATHSWDGEGDGGGGVRVAWAFGWSGVGTPSWERPTSGTVTYNLGNDPAKPWWFRLKQPTFMLDKPGFDSKSPAFVNATTIIIPGRSGVWRYERGINKAYPACEGMQATYAWGTLCHPTDGLKGMFLDTDWNVIRWNAGPWAPPLMRNDTGLQGSPSSMVAWGGAITPGAVVAVSSGEHGSGMTHTCENPWATDPAWTRQDNTGAGTKPPANEQRGNILWGAEDGTLRLGICIQGSGMWMKTGSGASGTWVNAIPDAKAGGKQSRMLSAVSGDAGVVCDQSSGLWMTTNKGATWTQRRSGGAGNILSGHVAPDPATPGGFLHVANEKLYRISTTGVLSDIGIAAMIAPTAVASWKSGAKQWVAVADGPRLWLSKNAGTWTDVSNASWRQATGNLLRGLAWTADGVLIGVCQSGYTCLLLNVDVT